MRATTTVNIPEKPNPFLDRPSQRSTPAVIRKFIILLQALFGGAGLSKRQGEGASRQTAALEYGLDPAIARVTVAAPAVSATITLNGTAITAAEHRANCTVTVGTSVDEDDTVTVNGTVFTAKAAPSGNYQWAITGVAATDAAALVAKINAASTNSADAVNGVGVYGKIRAVRPAADGVVNIYAIAEGTAGNSYTIATSDAVDLAITNDSSGNFAGGAAATNNEWDHIGTNADIARSICTNLDLSSTAILNKHVTAACRQAVVTCATVLYADTVTLDSFVLRAIKETTDSGGARITTFPDDVFGIGANDTATATGLVNCIKNHPKLRERFFASSSTGTVTIQERPPEAANPPPISSSNGSRLAVTIAVNGLFADSTIVLIQSVEPGHRGNAVTIATSSGTTLAITGSASRLAGGTSTVLTV